MTTTASSCSLPSSSNRHCADILSHRNFHSLPAKRSARKSQGKVKNCKVFFFLLREASEEKLSMSFSSAFSCLHFSNDLLCNRGRSFRTNTASFDTGEVRREQAEAFNYIATMIYGSFRSSPAHSDPSSRMISTASCGRKRPKDCQLSIGVDLSKDLSDRNAI
jgi:hypothetical protein